jgi:hypothetical protein
MDEAFTRLRDRRRKLESAMMENRNKVSALETAYVTMLKDYRQLEIEELHLLREAAKLVPTDILK